MFWGEGFNIIQATENVIMYTIEEIDMIICPAKFTVMPKTFEKHLALQLLKLFGVFVKIRV